LYLGVEDVVKQRVFVGGLDALKKLSERIRLPAAVDRDVVRSVELEGDVSAPGVQRFCT
jgi:hypothetical protein